MQPEATSDLVDSVSTSGNDSMATPDLVASVSTSGNDSMIRRGMKYVQLTQVPNHSDNLDFASLKQNFTRQLPDVDNTLLMSAIGTETIRIKSKLPLILILLAIFIIVAGVMYQRNGSEASAAAGVRV